MALKEQYSTDFLDKKIIIDGSRDLLVIQPGEKAHYQTKNVVDMQSTKQITENNKQGTMILTNIRLLYYLDYDLSVYISVGYSCVSKILVGNIDEQTQKQPIVQQNRTLIVNCKQGNNKMRFEFLPRGSRSVFELFQNIYRAYDTSRAFRVTRVRTTLISNGILQLLADELTEHSFPDTQMSSPLAPQPAGGRLYITNFRILWQADQNIQYNVSVPFIDVLQLQLNSNEVYISVTPPDGVESDSKTIKTLTVKFQPFGITGEQLYEILSNQVKKSQANPHFGVQIQNKEIKNEELAVQKIAAPRADEKLSKIVKGVDRIYDYLQEQQVNKQIFCHSEYGVAFEVVEGGLSVEELWSL